MKTKQITSRIFLAIFLSLCSLSFINAQIATPVESGEKSKNKVSLQSLEGTFQFQMINNRYKPVIAHDLPQRIEDHRKDHEDSYLKINSKFRILVLSRDKINSPNFEPIEHQTIWIRE